MFKNRGHDELSVKAEIKLTVMGGDNSYIQQHSTCRRVKRDLYSGQHILQITRDNSVQVSFTSRG